MASPERPSAAVVGGRPAGATFRLKRNRLSGS